MNTINFAYGHHLFQVKQNTLGKEVLKINGKTISESTSLFGSTHVFGLSGFPEQNFELKTKFGLFGNGYEMSKNGELIQKQGSFISIDNSESMILILILGGFLLF